MFLVEYRDRNDNASYQLYSLADKAIKATKRYLGLRSGNDRLEDMSKWSRYCVWHQEKTEKGSADIFDLKIIGDQSKKNLYLTVCTPDESSYAIYSDPMVVKQDAFAHVASNIDDVSDDEYVRVEGPPNFGDFSWQSPGCCWWLEGFIAKKTVFREERYHDDPGVMGAFNGVPELSVRVYKITVNGPVVG